MQPPPTPCRLNRLALWAGLWLARAVAALPLMLDLIAADPALREALRRRLDEIERTLLGVIAWRAILAHGPLYVREQAMRRRDRRAGAALRRRSIRLWRVLFGRGLLDPRLRSRDPAVRIAALCALHARLDQRVARLLKRLKRGLRSLLALVMTRPPPRRLPAAAPFAPPAFADSS
jgi:hypothetical protein